MIKIKYTWEETKKQKFGNGKEEEMPNLESSLEIMFNRISLLILAKSLLKS